MEAAVKATKEIALAVMATTLSLSDHFVPVAFARLRRRYLNQFGWTMAMPIMVSISSPSINAVAKFASRRLK
jgi:HAE1 family hydrophobic/amphiphilic exporter-1